MKTLKDKRATTLAGCSMCESAAPRPSLENESNEASGLILLVVLLVIAIACAVYVLITLPEALDTVACVINRAEHPCHPIA